MKSCPKRYANVSPKSCGYASPANLRRNSSLTFAFMLDSGIGSRVETLFDGKCHQAVSFQRTGATGGRKHRHSALLRTQWPARKTAAHERQLPGISGGSAAARSP